MKKTVAITLCFLIYVVTFCQVGIGTNTPYPSAALDVSSNAKGLLIPQMTQVQRSIAGLTRTIRKHTGR